MPRCSTLNQPGVRAVASTVEFSGTLPKRVPPGSSRKFERVRRGQSAIVHGLTDWDGFYGANVAATDNWAQSANLVGRWAELWISGTNRRAVVLQPQVGGRAIYFLKQGIITEHRRTGAAFDDISYVLCQLAKTMRQVSGARNDTVA